MGLEVTTGVINATVYPRLGVVLLVFATPLMVVFGTVCFFTSGLGNSGVLSMRDCAIAFLFLHLLLEAGWFSPQFAHFTVTAIF